MVGLLVVMSYLVAIQGKECNQHAVATNEQIGTLTTQIIIGENVKRIRRMIPCVTINFSKRGELVHKYFLRWQTDYMCHRKSYLQQRLLMSYMHEEDGKK